MMTFKKYLSATCLLVLSSGCATLNQSKEPSLGDDDNVGVPQLIAIGDDALRKGDIKTAQIKYALAAERDPNNIGVLYKLGVIHSEQGTFNVAEGLLRRALKLSPGHQGSNEALGMLMMKQERLAEAKDILSAALEKRPDSWRVLNALGIIEDMSAMHLDAQEYFVAALYIAPRSATLLNNIGYSYYLNNDYVNAEDYFKQALQYDPENSNAWSNLGLTYSRQGRHNDAKASFMKIVDTHQAANNLGYLALLQDNHDLAYSEFNSAINTSPSYYEKANQNLNSLQNAPMSASAAKLQNTSANSSFAATPIITVGAQNNSSSNSIQETKLSPTELRADSLTTVTLHKTTPIRKARRTAGTSKASISQAYLNYLGFDVGKLDGKFGNQTQSALSHFQYSIGVEETGKLDRLTTDRLAKVAIEQLQNDLIALGFNPGEPDGKVGKGTRSALKRFSSKHGVEYTGKIDNRLLSGIMQIVDKQKARLNSPNLVDLSSRG